MTSHQQRLKSVHCVAFSGSYHSAEYSGGGAGSTILTHSASCCYRWGAGATAVIPGTAACCCCSCRPAYPVNDKAGVPVVSMGLYTAVRPVALDTSVHYLQSLILAHWQNFHPARPAPTRRPLWNTLIISWPQAAGGCYPARSKIAGNIVWPGEGAYHLSLLHPISWK